VNRKKWLVTFSLLLSLIMVFSFASVALASSASSAHEGAQAPISAPEGSPPVFPNFYVMGWSLVNFLALLALLYKFAYGPVNEMLEQRSTAIEGSIRHAEQLKADVEKMKNEAQANLTDARKEAQEIVNRANKAAEDVKTDMVAKANEEVANLKARAKDEMDAAIVQAKAELKDMTVALAIAAAEKVISREFNKDDHSKMVQEFVGEAGDFLC